MEDVGWTSDRVLNQKKDRTERYRAEKGRKDLIRVLTTCWAHPMHWLDDKGFYMNCGQDKEGGGTCLACQAQNTDGTPVYPRLEKYGALIMHIAEKTGQGEWKRIDQVKFWGFGNDKYILINELVDELGDIRKHDLIITCQDSKLQKLNIRPAGGESKIDKKALEAQWAGAQKSLNFFMGTPTLEKQKEIFENTGVNDEVESELPEALKDLDTPEIDGPEKPALGDDVDSLLADIGGL